MAPGAPSQAIRSDSPRPGARVGLLAVLAAGLLLRAWQLDFGLDRHDISQSMLVHQQDEADMAQAVLHGILRGVPDPGRFMLWGSANFWLFGLADFVVLGPAALVTGEGWGDVLARLEENPSVLHLVHRGVSLLASLAMLLVLWRLLRREAGERAALAGTALLAAAYLPAREAHFGTLDTTIAL
ncbi:MAG: hypothetical protein FJ296_02145, partial [Planctomycetes bacterium]|nr:hypothetical protein [Planctomycetota bacterium]